MKLYTICLTLLMLMLCQRIEATTTITYTSASGQKVSSNSLQKLEDQGDVVHTYEYGVGTITFKDNITTFPAIFGSTDVSTIVIPEGITSISGWGFQYCSSLTSIELPDGLTSIGSSCFLFCDKLQSIAFPSSLTSIGPAAFYSCSSLSSVEIHDGLTTIGANAFQFCGAITSIYLPNTLTTISSYAFYECVNLSSIELPASLKVVEESAFYGCFFLSLVNHSNLEYDEKWGCQLIDVVTEDGLYISNNVVVTNRGATEVTVPEGVTSIAAEAFLYSGLTSIVLSSTVRTIEKSAFYGCKELSSIVLNDGLTSIGTYALSGCSSLHSLTIPSSVTSIGEYALLGIIFQRDRFVNNSACTDPENWGAEYVDYITPDGFIVEDGVVTRYLGNSIHVAIPDGAVMLNRFLFNSSNIVSVQFPESLTYIDNFAFSRCSALRTIIAGATPPNADTYSFDYCNDSEITVYVPMGSASVYRSHRVWKKFKIQETSFDINHDGEINIGDVTKLVRYIQMHKGE